MNLNRASLITFSIVILLCALNATPALTEAKIVALKDTTIIQFESAGTLRPKLVSSSPTEFKLNINCQLSNLELSPKGLIKDIKAQKDSVQTTLTFFLKKPCNWYARSTPSGYEVCIFPQNVTKIKTIVLDPGHGGIDPGAISKSGIKEKNVNLAIAKLLKKKLEKAGLKVFMTRDQDEFVPLALRTQFANNKNADLFISLHCNASASNKYASGFETYFLSEARTDLERAALMRENEALKYEKDKKNLDADLDLVLADLLQTEQLKESYNLALAIQTAAVNILKDTDRGVKQAGFYVLRGCFMPAVLVECGFLSNRVQARQLNDPKYQNKIAEAIYQGIINYIKDYESRYGL
ncbi:MAG: N-acetylmuramoyl-L-alanine amidase [candidate division WOR-3 bacterium]|nr:N-acetylmuramoyl-L-alanine amidase [candidate division WOR-3 bacterium]MCX7757981.1 N-acetylmuramoyl-L-alanine amidase [candidate division WOR-3 bacterium]MDW7987213.1 N-acetylmuramoyl-L-alanine amidase [candidate division WOR-3 bacterium]